MCWQAGQANIHYKSKNKQYLPKKVELLISMKVMVTTNIKTDLDIMNGACGTIKDIVLHPEEVYQTDAEEIAMRLPLYFLMKFDWTHTMLVLEGKSHQFPATPTYTFTNYWSQGQMIPHIIVDIANLPMGRLSLFNLYVALSWSSGSSTVRLLWDFDAKVSLAAHSPKPIMEGDRLRALDTETKRQWELMGQGEYRWSNLPLFVQNVCTLVIFTYFFFTYSLVFNTMEHCPSFSLWANTWLLFVSWSLSPVSASSCLYTWTNCSPLFWLTSIACFSKQLLVCLGQLLAVICWLTSLVFNIREVSMLSPDFLMFFQYLIIYASVLLINFSPAPTPALVENHSSVSHCIFTGV